jgi:hypothetical protein
VLDLRTRAEFSILVLPNFQQIFYRLRLELGEREAVIRAVTNNSRDSGGWLVAINAGRRLQRLRRIKPDTGMIVIKDERSGVVVVARTVDAKVTRAEIAIRNLFRQQAAIVFDRLTAPRAVLPVSGNDYPLLT